MRRSLITSALALTALAALSCAAAQAQQTAVIAAEAAAAGADQAVHCCCGDAAAALKPIRASRTFISSCSTSAAHKDRAALAKLTVAQGFFWIQDKDLADKSKSGIDNLAKAIGLDAKDGSGWDVVTGFANDPTATDLPEHKGVICSPADPNIDPKAFEALGEATQTDPSEWGYPLKDGTRSALCPATECAGDRKARPQPGARAARHCAAERCQPAGVPACRNAIGQIWLHRHGLRLRRSAATKCAIRRMRAAGRSPAISAASPSSAVHQSTTWSKERILP